MKTKKCVGRPKSQKKKQSILEAATCLFLENGYGNTSMDDVAKCAGVSKQTVYGHFSNKENLFRATVIQKSDEFSPSLDDLDQQGVPPKELLWRLGEGFLDLMYSKECMLMQRLLIGDAGQHPRAVEIFFEAGPKRMLSMLEKYFRRQNEKKTMVVPNPAIAADHFFSMVKGVHHLALLLGIKESISPEERNEYIQSVIDVFTKVYEIKG